MQQPDREWIQRKLSRLTAHADDLQEIGEANDEPEFGAWTALKLTVFTATVDVYTKIIANNDFDFYYIDSMSGSGIVNLSDRDDTISGSPIIAGTVAHEPFERMYFIEEDPERASSLRSRLDYAVEEIDAFDQSRGDCVVIEGDANDVLPTIRDRIEDHRGGSLSGHDGENGQHHLAFIDNERDDVKFQAIRELESMWGDLLINYPEVSLDREEGRIESGLTDSWDDYIAFFDGDESVQHMRSRSRRFNLYLEKLEDISRPIHPSTKIHGSSSHRFSYRLVYAAQETEGGSEFAEFMTKQGRKIENLTGDDIEHVLDTMRGEATHLGLWSVDDEDQSALGSF